VYVFSLKKNYNKSIFFIKNLINLLYVLSGKFTILLLLVVNTWHPLKTYYDDETNFHNDKTWEIWRFIGDIKVE
jgi:hypothetical protein